MSEARLQQPPGQENCPCNSETCPLQNALSLIGGKWKIPILCALNQDGETRYNALKRKIRGITNTMLARSLKELESDGLILRAQYMEMPLRVEYTITDRARQLIPILAQLAHWGAQNSTLPGTDAASDKPHA